jgi:cation diffusion facilitator family transporter
MPEPERPTQVYAAALANFVIAGTKLIAAAVTGSSAMLSEGIHSTADTGNQLLMLLGLKRSRRPADSIHPFGTGQEVYFWSFVVAMVLLSGGGVLSVYEGIRRLKYSEGLSDPFWNYIVLAIAAVSESTSMYFALRTFRQSTRLGEHWWDSLRTSKDPSVFIVLAEDAAALTGIVVAFLGILLEQMTGNVVPDAIAAMVIGGICVL